MEYLIQTDQKQTFLNYGGKILEDKGDYLIGVLNTTNLRLKLKLAVIFTPRIKLQRP